MGLKARVKATGTIVEVDECGGQVFEDMGWYYMDMRGRCYKSEDLDFSDNTPFDYWTRLEHQAAIAAMQAQMAPNCLDSPEGVACTAYAYAHALVEKYKKEEK